MLPSMATRDTAWRVGAQYSESGHSAHSHIPQGRPPLRATVVPVRPLLALALALTAACSSAGGDPSPVPAEVTGVIIEIERGDGGEIAAFTVRENEGSSYGIRIDHARDYGFDLEHLVEHQTTGDPVVVTTEDRDGSAYATSIVDA